MNKFKNSKLKEMFADMITTTKANAILTNVRKTVSCTPAQRPGNHSETRSKFTRQSPVGANPLRPR